MTRTKKRLYATQLPATPCSEEMRIKIVGVAEKKELSIADVQRQAFEFFLHHFDSIPKSNVSTATQGRES